VSPGVQYRLNFQAMTRSFVSAATPVVRVIDASNGEGAVLGQSSNLTDATSWRGFAIDFTTNGNTHAIQLIVSRAGCPAPACAAFGTVWLDSFTLEVISSSSGN
jgi:hypothetical protein